MTTEEWWSLFLGCLSGSAILVFTFAARTMWRRGSARAAARRYPPPMLCPVCLARHYPRCPAAVSGWSPPCVTPAGNAGPTAPTTTPGTGGSPSPDSAGDRSRLQHNPGSGRRGQFGMCDYP